MDIAKLFDDPWPSLIWRVRQGQFPTDEELASALRADRTNEPLPPQVRDYLAGRLDGSIRRLRGRPARVTDWERWTPAINTAYQVRMLQAAYKIAGLLRPRDRAIEDVARRANRSTDTIRAKVKSINKAPIILRSIVPTAKDACKLLVEFRAEEGGGPSWINDYIKSMGGKGVR